MFNKCNYYYSEDGDKILAVSTEELPKSIKFKKKNYSTNDIPITLLDDSIRREKELDVVYLLDSKQNIGYQYTKLQKNIKAESQYLMVDNRIYSEKIKNYRDAIKFCLKREKKTIKNKTIEFLIEIFKIDSNYLYFSSIEDNRIVNTTEFVNELKCLGYNDNGYFKKFCNKLVRQQKENIKEKSFQELKEEVEAIEVGQNGVVYIDAALGLGKTEMLEKKAKQIKEADKNISIHYPTYRISLNNNACERFGFDDYRSLRDDINNSKFSSIVINSLPKIYKGVGEGIGYLPKHSYDLFLDEVDFCLAQLTSKLIANKPDLYKLLCEFITNARTVYVTQYKISEKTKYFINEICMKRVIYDGVCTEQPKLDKEISYFETKAELKKELVADIKNKKKVFCTVSTSIDGKELQEIISMTDSSYKTLFIESDNANDEKQANFLKNPNQEACKYDAIIATSVIESGFNINIDRFDVNIGLYDLKQGFSCSPVASCQMLFRNRRASEYKVYVSNYTKYNTTDIDVINHNIYEEQLKQDKKVNKYDYFNCETEFYISLFGQFVAEIVAEENKQYNNPLRYMFDYFTDMGFTITIPKIEIKKEDETLFKEAKKEVKRVIIENVKNSNNIDDREASIINLRKSSNAARSYELDELTKFDVNELFKTDIDTLKEAEYTEKINLFNGGIIKGLLNMYLIQVDDSDIDNIEASYLENNPNIPYDHTNPKRYLKVKHKLLKAIASIIFNSPNFSMNEIITLIENDFIKTNELGDWNSQFIGLSMKNKKITAKSVGMFIRNQFQIKLKSVQTVRDNKRVRLYCLNEESARIMQSLYNMHVDNDKFNFYPRLIENGIFFIKNNKNP